MASSRKSSSAGARKALKTKVSSSVRAAKKSAANGRAVKTAKSRGASLQTQAAREIWPLERDVLFRPDRFKYVRKLIKPEGCVFCSASKEEMSFDSLCVHQTEHSMVVLNKFPYNSGHLLVLPRRHCGDMLKIPAVEFADLNETLRFAMQAQQDLYQPAGQNIGLNHGAVAGAGIPDHLHFHIIPRWAGDLNFFPLIADTKVVIETLEQTWDRFRSHFRTHHGRHR